MPEFDVPIDNNDEMFQNENQKTNIMEKIKPYFGTIIKVVILLAILIVAYYFFFYRYTTVSFDVYNYDSGKSETTTITLVNGTKSINVDTFEEIKLLPGDYSISLQGELAKMYLKDKFISIDKSRQGEPITISVYPNWVKDISDLKLTGPNNIYTNQNIPLQVSLKYSGNPMTVKFLGLNDFNGLNENQDLKTGENNFTFFVKNTKKLNDKIKGSIYIEKAKYLTNTKTNEFTATVKKAPVIKITNSKTVYETSAGQELKITFDISNDSQETINGLDMSFDGANMDIDIFKSYITSSPSDINIGAKGSASVDLILTIPLQTTFEGKKDITFNVVVSNSYTTASKKLTINYTSPNITIPKLTDFGNIVSGSNVKKTVTIENGTKYPIKIQDSKLLVTSETTNLESAIYQQISYDVPESLNPGKNDINMIAVIPYTFVTDKFNAELQLTTDIGILKVPLAFAFSGIDVKLDPKLNSQYTFVFSNDVVPMSEAKSYDISVKNSGNVDLNGIYLQIAPTDGSSTCQNAVKLSQTTNLSIPKGETLSLFLTLQKIPKSQLEEQRICNFDIIYTDPRTNTQQTKTTQFIIN